MATKTVTFPVDLGGSGTTYRNDAGTNGMASGNGYAYTETLFDLTGEIIDVAGGVKTNAESAATDAGTAATEAATATAARTAIDNRIYSGTYASAPTTRPGGGSIQNGDMYFGTDGFTYVRVSGAWVNQTSAAAASASAASDSETAASASATAASNSEAAASASATAAASAQSATESARDAALAAAAIYADTTAGLAATASGGYFYVPSSEPHEALVLYRDNAGVAVEVKRYISADVLVGSVPIGWAWSVQDGNGAAAIGLMEDGTFVAQEMTVGAATASSVTTPGGQITGSTFAQHVWAVEDSVGNAAVAVRADGTVDMAAATCNALQVASINGEPATNGAIARGRGAFASQLAFINNTGQSLGEGSTPAVAVTTAQEYDNVGFAARANAPTSLVALTVALTQYSSRGESPMYGTLGFIKDRIAAENGITYTKNDYQLAACNNAYSGYSITALNKGTTPYTLAMSQVQAAHDIAVAAGKTMSYAAVTWTQGEADTAMAKATYKAHLIQLAKDYDADGRAITGQGTPVRFITYQCATANVANIAQAQLEASNECPLITLACPMYQFDYGDTQHVDSTSAKWLGGYYGLAYKRLVIDGQDWKPLQPVAHAVLGSTIDLVFNKSGLVLDTTLVPAQTNYGFSVKDGSNVAQTISSVVLIAPNRVRITVSGTPAAGWSVQYGNNSASGKSPFVGGCGNLRDSQGDVITYAAISKPMHNWCVIFNYTI